MRPTVPTLTPSATRVRRRRLRLARLGGAAVLAASALVAGPAALLAASATPAAATGRVAPDVSHAAPRSAPLNGQYWLAAADGGVFAFGGARYFGSMVGRPLHAAVVGMAVDGPGFGLPGVSHPGEPPAVAGYWEVAADGGVFAFGAAPFLGSMGDRPLAAPVVGMAVDPGHDGYYEVGADGGVFAFGGAAFYGSMGGKALAAPIVSMTATPDGGGYWLVGADGGVFAYGDAAFLGSLAGTGGTTVGLAAQADDGYWLAKANGRIHNYGTAPDEGSTPTAPAAPVVGIASTGSQGYWMAGSDGGVFALGDAGYSGGLVGTALNAPVVAIAASPLVV